MSLDVSLTADVLRLAISAALGHRANITSVRDAAVRLGTSTLLSLTLASRVGGRILRAAGVRPPAGSALEALGGRVDRGRGDPLPRPCSGPGGGRDAALLHDFGKIVLARHFGKQILETLALAAATDGVDLLDTERVVSGSPTPTSAARWPRRGDSR